MLNCAWLGRAPRFIAVFCVQALAGCATIYPPLPGDSPSPQAGSLVLSLASAEKYPTTMHTLKIRRRGEDAGYQVSYRPLSNLFPALTPQDFSEGAANGVVVVGSIPPGDYEVQNFSSSRYGYPVSRTFSSQVDAAIPFSIRPGEATYIGEYQAREVNGRNLFGAEFTVMIYFVVTDKSDRDLGVAARKMPALQGRKANKEILRGGQSRTPLIRTDAMPASLQ
jgi:hypothetical protein